ncbi:hypothetical protein ACIBCT_29040 [Streptosporangium sp. NPDC050855]
MSSLLVGAVAGAPADAGTADTVDVADTGITREGRERGRLE